MTRETYAQHWDRYVATMFPRRKKEKGGDLSYPGSEWGSESSWNGIFDHLFVPAHVANWKYAIEIGGGAGKYTERVLGANDQVRVWGYDVSRNFLEATEKRLNSFVQANRLVLNEIDGANPDAIFRTFEKEGLVRKVDAMFSIDAMVHVDLQYLVTYWINAALVLKRGGFLVMTLADPTSEVGFKKLIRDIRKFYKYQGRMCPKFEYMSIPIVTYVLENLGFTIDYLQHWKYKTKSEESARDMYLIARLDRPEQADRYRDALRVSAAGSLETGLETYGEFWDRYLESGQSRSTRDGDEYWDAICDYLFERAGVKSWNNAIELGGREGRFSRRVLTSNDKVKVWGFDVSRKYNEAATRGLREYVNSGRLSLHLLNGESPDYIVNVIEGQGKLRTIDAVFSVAAMVHVDLQYLVTYWINAALVLKKGGRLIMALADATSPGGFSGLIADIEKYYPLQGRVCLKHEYLSANMVVAILARLGFEIEYLEPWSPPSGEAARELVLVAKLARPQKADRFHVDISTALTLSNSPSPQVATREIAGAEPVSKDASTGGERGVAEAIGKAYWRTLLKQSDPNMTKEQLKEKVKHSWGGARQQYTRLGITVLRQLENMGYAVTKNPSGAVTSDE